MTDMTIPSRLYDQVLLEFEMGRIQQATLLLAGTLDGVVAQGGDILRWKAQLRDHALGDVLASQSCRTDNQRSLFRPSRQDSTSRVLADTLSGLGAFRAISAREALRRSTTEQVLARGGRVLDLSDDAEACGLYDMVVAVELADALPLAALGQRLEQLSHLLAQDGTILLSSMAPGHFGQGWQVVCGDAHRQCHDETALTRAADAAALHLTHFRDASDSLIWGMLSRKNNPATEEGERNG